MKKLSPRLFWPSFQVILLQLNKKLRILRLRLEKKTRKTDAIGFEAKNNNKKASFQSFDLMQSSLMILEIRILIKTEIIWIERLMTLARSSAITIKKLDIIP